MRPKHQHHPPGAPWCTLCGYPHKTYLRVLPPITLQYLQGRTRAARLMDFEIPCYNAVRLQHTHTLRLWAVKHTCGSWTPFDVTSDEGTELSPPAVAFMPQVCLGCAAPLGRFAPR